MHITWLFFQSEEDSQLQEELNMLVERLQVGRGEFSENT